MRGMFVVILHTAVHEEKSHPYHRIKVKNSRLIKHSLSRNHSTMNILHRVFLPMMKKMSFNHFKESFSSFALPYRQTINWVYLFSTKANPELILY
jgi:hypothetical protein